MSYTTFHDLWHGDSRSLIQVPSGSVQLVVTSPPYPMVEMWDKLFAGMDPAVGRSLAHGKGYEAFDRMHQILLPVWKEVARVLAPGGVACINIGDATRRVGNEFRLYPNHARISTDLDEVGLAPLPSILWQKTTNKPTKFMGSGMLPGGAYATLEHEHILLARKGGLRSFSVRERARRRESAYFWEERNLWFQDLWTGLVGARQEVGHGGARRSRSAAYPLEIPYRLIAMYSLQGDTVLDPFVGTGTTSVAAACLGRNSLGIDLEDGLRDVSFARMKQAPRSAEALLRSRLQRHKRFLATSRAGKTARHRSRVYGFPVVTQQETDLRIPVLRSLERISPERLRATYE